MRRMCGARWTRRTGACPRLSGGLFSTDGTPFLTFSSARLVKGLVRSAPARLVLRSFFRFELDFCRVKAAMEEIVHGEAVQLSRIWKVVAGFTRGCTGIHRLRVVVPLDIRIGCQVASRAFLDLTWIEKSNL